jgi:NAD(P)H-dependent FMN reductase
MMYAVIYIFALIIQYSLTMPHIAILSSSVRTGRVSHRIALYFKRFLEEKNLATGEILDLLQFKFPVFEERLKYQPNPSAEALDFASRITQADGVIIVTPEYNGGYPASLKNAIDLLYKEWQRKPIAIAAVSDGSFGGTQVIMSLQFSLWKIGAWTVPSRFHVPDADKNFDEQGGAINPAAVDKRTTVFINELLWCVMAKQKMEQQ